MKKLISVLTSCLLITVPCVADTFTHRETGKVFNGFVTQEKRGSRTLIRVGDRQAPEYVDLLDYNIEWNTLGRRNQVVILSIEDAIELECETIAFEKAMRVASNQGPLLIIIELDTPGGRGDLMKRICDAILSAGSCRTAAFVSGGQYGGAYSAGAVIALACDYIYMADGTSIGAASPSLGVAELSALSKASEEKILSAERTYVASLAEQNGRSGLFAKAMVDRNIEVLEVVEGGKSIFITPEERKEYQTVQRVWSRKGSLLTLTADEASRCGIANKILNSADEVISGFGFEEPKLVRSQDIVKARRQFETAKDKIKNFYNDIDYLRKDIRLKLDLYSEVDVLYHRAVRGVVYYDGYLPRANSYISAQREEMRRLVAQRKTLKSTLLRALEQLKLKYLAILALKKANPDLQIDEEAVNREINSIDVLHKNILENPVFDRESTRVFIRYEDSEKKADVERSRRTSP